MSISVQREVSNWKLEARLEDNDRYFFQPHDLSRIRMGENCYVIGRKGSGKTAISEYLYGSKGPKTFTYRLTFKNFPFNDLYALSNDKYRAPNQYITLWKYLIYSSVAKMMASNENIDSAIRNILQNTYLAEPDLSLPRTVARWTSANFGLSLLGSGATGGGVLTHQSNNTPWIERVEVLENVISKYLDDSEYLLVFDELDENYGSGTETPTGEYWQLLTSLFKAVQDVRATLRSDRYKIYPVVFLRDDIYEQLLDSDKTKWEDLIFRLDWTPETIKRLLAFRISRAADQQGAELEFEKAWGMLYQPLEVHFGKSKNKTLGTFEFITRAGCWRPRDYVRYMKATAQRALAMNESPVSATTVYQAQKEFSNYLRSEMEDEIRGVLPNVRTILDIIAHIRKPIFPPVDFQNAYVAAKSRTTGLEQEWEGVLRVLFHFSVLGNVPRQKNIYVFHYTNKEARLNFSENMVIHPGLLKALQIL